MKRSVARGALGAAVTGLVLALSFVGADSAGAAMTSFAFDPAGGNSAFGGSATAAAAAPTSLTFGAEADAKVDQSSPTANFGTADLRVDGGPRWTVESYLRFSLSGLSGVIQSARLRIYAYSPGTDGPAVYTTGSAWSEGALSWANRPARTSAAWDDKGAVARDTWVEYDVTPFIAGNGTYSFALASPSTDGIDFYSREDALKPELVVSTTPGLLQSRTLGTTRSWGTTTVADFNLDGLDDYLAPRHEFFTAQDRTWLQQADGTFVEGFVFPPRDRHGCTAGDVNGDGLPDLYCMQGAHRGEAEKRNELWMARPDGTYVNEAALWGVEDPTGRGRRPLLFDFDDDGLLDLYITNWGDRPDGRRNENILYLNTGRRFEELPVSATGSHGAACVEAGDWDGDGRLDLLVCGPQLHLFRNVGGWQTELKDELLGSERVSWPHDASLSDLNGDGKADLVIVKAGQLQIRLNRGAGPRFSHVDHRLSLVNGMSVAVGDFTGDRLPDIYVVQGYASDRNWDDLLLPGPTWLPIDILQTTGGYGCQAEPIGVRGRQGVLVTNGCWGARGPVQIVGRFP